MERDFESVVEEIMCLMECPSDFACYRKKLRPLCKTQDIGMKDYVEVSKNGHWCTFLMVLGERYFCRCPLCVYLTKQKYH